MTASVDVVDGRRPGGANTSHTIAVALLSNLLTAGGNGTEFETYQRIAIDQNILGRSTYEGRRRTFRYLRELYVLDPAHLLFRALRELWCEDPAALAQLAGISALARDSAFRASAATVLRTRPGDLVRPDDFARDVDAVFPGAYNASTLHKIGRNTASSWTQTGHLSGRTRKTRTDLQCRPIASVYAVFIGHLAGLRGEALLDTVWTRFLVKSSDELFDDLRVSTQRGYLEFRSGGGVVECGFSHLMRPIEESAR